MYAVGSDELPRHYSPYAIMSMISPEVVARTVSAGGVAAEVVGQVRTHPPAAKEHHLPHPHHPSRNKRVDSSICN